ncbi:WYL domain-containing protein [Saccharomonospora sp. NPDC046836]|uniref:WYL domain-containing protein n=1 Tax=Saccharomonospora sp. NPDC046836 TaxID=3156921 RepID=UPI0033CFB314
MASRLRLARCPAGSRPVRGDGPAPRRGAAGGAGWIEAVIPTESTEHGYGELLRLGIDVEVVAPAELRQAMADTVGVPARAHGCASSPSASFVLAR